MATAIHLSIDHHKVFELLLYLRLVCAQSLLLLCDAFLDLITLFLQAIDAIALAILL